MNPRAEGPEVLTIYVHRPDGTECQPRAWHVCLGDPSDCHLATASLEEASRLAEAIVRSSILEGRAARALVRRVSSADWELLDNGGMRDPGDGPVGEGRRT